MRTPSYKLCFLGKKLHQNITFANNIKGLLTKGEHILPNTALLKIETNKQNQKYILFVIRRDCILHTFKYLDISLFYFYITLWNFQSLVIWHFLSRFVVSFEIQQKYNLFSIKYRVQSALLFNDLGFVNLFSTVI